MAACHRRDAARRRRAPRGTDRRLAVPSVSIAVVVLRCGGTDERFRGCAVRDVPRFRRPADRQDRVRRGRGSRGARARAGRRLSAVRKNHSRVHRRDVRDRDTHGRARVAGHGGGARRIARAAHPAGRGAAHVDHRVDRRHRRNADGALLRLLAARGRPHVEGRPTRLPHRHRRGLSRDCAVRDRDRDRRQPACA